MGGKTWRYLNISPLKIGGIFKYCVVAAKQVMKILNPRRVTNSGY
jgi:hypothetical protein